MRILVTGGAGFIGSHISEAALAAGHEVCVLDNLSSGRRKNVPAAARFEQIDIRDSVAVDALIADFRPDAVSHQAAQASVSVSMREPLLDASVNLIGSLNILEACRAHGVGRFVFASTGGAIYGEVPEGHAATEETTPAPLSPYAASKLAVEGYLATYATLGVQSTVLRYANVYGPRQDPHGEAGVVAIFAQRLLAAEPLRIYARQSAGDGGCVRDYVYVGEVVRANLAALEGRLPHRVMNVGTGLPTTTAELLATMQAGLGTSAVAEQAGVREGDLQRSLLSPARFSAALGGITSLADGLATTVDWFRAQTSGS
jgi:UDP-glucose 4-epimerase